MVTVALIVAIVGLVLYLPSINPKVNEVGRIMFFAGLLALLLTTVGAKVLV